MVRAHATWGCASAAVFAVFACQPPADPTSVDVVDVDTDTLSLAEGDRITYLGVFDWSGAEQTDAAEWSTSKSRNR
ncbi:MAG: hypothetical protein AAFQ82_19190 [Myxococcota bacterium]